MRAFKMIGFNDDNIKRIRYCFAESYMEAKRRFIKEYWYIKINEISECSLTEASINGVHN